MNGIVPALKDSLFEPTYDLAADYAETALDMLFDSDALKEIPIAKTIIALCNVGYNLHERNLLKQTISFITGFNSGSINPDKIKEYREMLDSDPKKAEKELGRVVIILGNHIECIQSNILGRFYSAYVKDAISWDKFCELSEANRRMFVSDYAVLREASQNKGIDLNGRGLYQIDRLISLGLLQNDNRLGGSVCIENMNSSIKGKDIIVTSFGKTFCQHMHSSKND